MPDNANWSKGIKVLKSAITFEFASPSFDRYLFVGNGDLSEVPPDCFGFLLLIIRRFRYRILTFDLVP